MDQLVEALAWMGTHYIEERFGKLAACLYVVTLSALSVGVALLVMVLSVRYLQ